MYNNTQSSGGSGSIGSFGLSYTVPEDGHYYIIAPAPSYNYCARNYDTPKKQLTTISDAGTLTRDFETGIYDLTSGTQISYTAKIGNTTSDANGAWGGGISLVVIKVG